MPTCVKVSAPGKIIIHGEHAVVYGREALASCIDKRTECTVTKLDRSDLVCLKVYSDGKLAEWNYKKDFLLQLKNESCLDSRKPSPLTIHELEILLQSKENEHIGKIDKLLLFIWVGLYLSIASNYVSKSDHGFLLEIKSELPLGAGVGSSASLSVCMAAAYLTICDFVTPVRKDSAGNEFHLRYLEQDLELINAWAFEAERVVHGSPSGVDNSIVCYGGALCYKKSKISFLESFPVIHVLLVSSGVSRSTLDVVKGVKERHSNMPAVYDALFDAMQQLTEEAKTNFLAMDQASRDVETSTELDGLYNKLIALTDINQNLLRAIGVSHESIEAILDILKKHEIKGKLTGAGAGGCVFAIIKPAISRTLVNDVIKELDESGFKSWLTCIGCEGVRWESIA